jgi:hypothetical protein
MRTSNIETGRAILGLTLRLHTSPALALDARMIFPLTQPSPPCWITRGDTMRTTVSRTNLRWVTVMVTVGLEGAWAG